MTTTTRRLACTLVALGLSAPLLAQPPLPTAEARRAAKAATWSAMSWVESWQARQGPRSADRVVKSFKVGTTGSLDIAAISGDVIVNEGGGDTITVEAIKHVRSKSAEEARQQLANTNVLMSQTGSRVEVRVDYTGRNNHASVDFTVTAPAGTVVNARSISGDVRVTNIHGEVRVESISGDVVANGTPNLVQIKTVSGDLELSGVSGQDQLRVSTVSGDLTVRSVKARSISAESVSGEVSLVDVACDTASVKSMSGDVEYAGQLSKSGRYELKSHSGDVRIGVPANIGFELDARTFSGNVRSDMPVTTRAGESAMGGRERKGLRGTYGDGSVFLLLTTFSGDIVVSKR
jgi:DUF4097 and DUF4098 domain-containing protein YvlB